MQCGKSAVQRGKLFSDVFRCIPETQSVTDMTTFWLFFLSLVYHRCDELFGQHVQQVDIHQRDM